MHGNYALALNLKGKLNKNNSLQIKFSFFFLDLKIA